jgi:predicted glycosyltransferase involved in capsule biosynthesis/capsule polysaccharide modification protein KpsS
VSVRLHAGNPWVLDRLEHLRRDQAAAPQTVVVDFGSQPPFAAAIEEACARFGLTYVPVDDRELFSLAKARNAGFRAASAPFVLFSDIDFVFRSDDFLRLERLIGALELERRIDQIVDFPAYHLSEAGTERWRAAEDRDAALERLAFRAVYEQNGGDFEFIAPYSNVFLVSAVFFEIVGGYDEAFRGHGSEDFEFLTRAAIHARYYRLPDHVEESCYSPARLDFFKPKAYRGYRRLLEAMCFPSELTGLKAFHLWHPRPEDDDWRVNNDWKRVKLAERFESYLGDWRRLLAVDHLARGKVAVCVCLDPSHDGYFLPLRAAGYGLVPVFNRSADGLARIAERMENGEIDAFAVFNPYMKSHKAVRGLFDKARALGLETIVVERGALPGTVYYARDVAYVDDAFSEAAFVAESFTESELEGASRFIEELRSGARALEQGADYAATRERLDARLAQAPATLAAAGGPPRPVVFVPLQLPEDMAVTLFVREEAERYDAFAASLSAVVESRPDLLFVIKAHPLAGETVLPAAPNAVVAEPDDNIHSLIDVADAVVCYNSGVGLLAILHEKPVVTVGNAFYNIGGTGHRAASLAEAVARAAAGASRPSRAKVERLCAWFTQRKYSTFVADDDIRETPTRKIHAYQNVLITTLRLDGRSYELGRMRQSGSFERKSYGAARLNLNDESREDAPELSRARAVLLLQLQSFVALCYPDRLRQKMLRAPRSYIRDSRNPLFRFVGRLVFGRDL